MNDYRAQAEQRIVDRARTNGGRCFLGYGEASAAMRLTKRGVGRWEQNHPFVAEFVLDGQAADGTECA